MNKDDTTKHANVEMGGLIRPGNQWVWRVGGTVFSREEHTDYPMPNGEP